MLLETGLNRYNVSVIWYLKMTTAPQFPSPTETDTY